MKLFYYVITNGNGKKKILKTKENLKYVTIIINAKMVVKISGLQNLLSSSKRSKFIPFFRYSCIPSPVHNTI